MTPALVSIIIPVYNTEEYIAQAIQTAIDQTWPNTEIIVVNDGSTDRSLAIVQSFKNFAITVISKSNAGAAAARNTGLKQAKGQYIQFLDADDLLSPDKISSQMEVLNGSDDYLAVCNTIHFKDGDDHLSLPITKEWFSKESDGPVDFLIKLYADNNIMPGYGGMIQPNAWLTPRKLIDKAGLWHNSLTLDDDGEFFCRTVLASKGIKFSGSGINYYRKYGTRASLSAQKSKGAMQSMLMATQLKYSHLKQRSNSNLIDQFFARQFWELGVAAYPRYKDVSAEAINKAKALGYRGLKYSTNKLTAILGKFIGWKILRLMSYSKHGF